ncbi:Acg family FMN-binding oxidoreductase [Rhodopirellula sallentina]|nr:nitroreductase family protein [Rhodopirellula sallentina]
MTTTCQDAAMRRRSSNLNKRLRGAVEFAVLAPSSHNTQPWKFRIVRDGIELYADRDRALPVVDPHDRELTISCGAALYHLRLALNCDSLATLIHVLPSADHPDLLARLRVSGPHTPDEDEQELFRAIAHRRTNRQPFDHRNVPLSIFDEWYLDLKEHNCWLQLVEDKTQKHIIADLISEGDRLQGSDRRFRRELSQWVHPNRTSCRDGMPGYAHGINMIASYLGPLMVRTFDWGEGQAAKDRQLAEGSPLLAIIGTQDDTPEAWMSTGQALAKMLLRGTSRGLSASFLNQPIEVTSLRPEIEDQCDEKGFPQILLRWGYGREVPATPRRSVEEVLV